MISSPLPAKVSDTFPVIDCSFSGNLKLLNNDGAVAVFVTDPWCITVPEVIEEGDPSNELDSLEDILPIRPLSY